MVFVPVPVADIPSGCLVRVHKPVEGKPYISILPLSVVHPGFVMTPIIGGAGTALTVKVYVEMAVLQGAPRGLFDVTVIVTLLPISDDAGV